MTPGLASSLLEAIDAIDEVGLRYAIVGGLAVGAWGVSRSTRDADLYAELPSSHRAELQQALQSRGYDVPAMNEELARFGVFRSKSKVGVFVDVFDAVGPFGEQLLARRKRITVFGKRLWVTTAEDLFLLKAFSDRPRDFDDLVSLASLSKLSLDLDYIETWAKLLDESIGGNEVSERVARAIDEGKRRSKG